MLELNYFVGFLINTTVEWKCQETFVDFDCTLHGVTKQTWASSLAFLTMIMTALNSINSILNESLHDDYRYDDDGNSCHLHHLSTNNPSYVPEGAIALIHCFLTRNAPKQERFSQSSVRVGETRLSFQFCTYVSAILFMTQRQKW